ncbi:MAG: RNA polymerase sigma factor [Gammaproteobacteria bacterium]|nr:RNA polymerase sigma factor [Gammaproteobacteria bacterium]
MNAEQERMLAAQICRGDQMAFRQFVDAYKDRVSGYIYRLIPVYADREEVCQDVFVKAWSHLDRFRFDSSLSTWLYRIAWRTAISHLRSHQSHLRHTVPVESDEGMAAEDQMQNGPLEQLGDEQMQGLVNGEINDLPMEERNILTLYHFLELGIRDISQITGRPEGTIKSDLFRVRKKLKDQVALRLGQTTEQVST